MTVDDNKQMLPNLLKSLREEKEFLNEKSRLRWALTLLHIVKLRKGNIQRTKSK